MTWNNLTLENNVLELHSINTEGKIYAKITKMIINFHVVNNIYYDIY